MRYIYILLILTFSISNAIGQDRCGTIQTQEMTDALVNNKKHWNETISRSLMPRFIPVTFHLIGENDGTRKATEELALEGLCILNESFEISGSNMFFYAAGFNELNNSSINNDPFGSGFLMRNQTDDASINIFIVNDISFGGTGRILGFYTPNGDYLVMRRDEMTSRTYTLEHEIGHFFTLKHTHYGWDGQYYEPGIHGDTVTLNTVTILEQGPVGTVVPVETQDGTNCDRAGDMICDTPPDYGFGFSCNCCILPWEVTDRNGDAIEPIMENIMSYSQGCDVQEFTPDQLVAINASLDANNRNYLRTNVTESEYTPVRGQVELVSPANGSTADVFNEVDFEWEAVENAEYYILTIVANQRLTIRTTEPRATVTDLSPNEAFIQWSVRAYNVFGGGCNGTEARLLNTGNTSAVTDIDFVSGINVYPNPVSTNTDVVVEFASEKSETAIVKLHTISGAVIYSEPAQIQTGNNRYVIQKSNLLNPGLFIFEIQTETGSILEKIIVR